MSKPTPGQTNIDIPWLSKSMTANERQQKRRDAIMKYEILTTKTNKSMTANERQQKTRDAIMKYEIWTTKTNKSMTANERQQKRRDAMRKKGLVKREVWIEEKYSEALAEVVKCLK